MDIILMLIAIGLAFHAGWRAHKAYLHWQVKEFIRQDKERKS